MNALDIVLIVAIAGVLGFAVWRVARNRRQGKTACGIFSAIPALKSLDLPP